MKTRFISRLASRGVLRVGGKDGQKFLQSLVTSDMRSLSPLSQSPTAFLDRRGRILNGALIHCTSPEEYYIDITRDHLPGLLRHLKMYKLRSSVDLDDMSDSYSVWQSVPGDTDGRLKGLGRRELKENRNGKEEQDDGEEVYEMWRCINGIPDGNDFQQGSLPLDLGLHLLNAVSFSKGCYLGQELTARTFFTGVLRNRITALIATDEDIGTETLSLDPHNQIDEKLLRLVDEGEASRVQVGDEIIVDGAASKRKKQKRAVVTSAAGNIGLAVLKMSDTFPSMMGDEDNEKDGESQGLSPVLKLASDGRRVYPIRQSWWSNEVTSTMNTTSEQS